MAGYIGSKAAVVSSGYPTGAERKNTFTITGTTTVLAGLSYTPNFTHVYHSGVRLVAGTDYTATDGTTITLTVAAENGDEIVVISYATFQVADAYTKAETYTKSEADAGFVSDPNGAILIDAAGRVTTPYQPAFNAKVNASTSITGSGWDKVSVGTIIYERGGSNYNTTNSRYTAPISGWYFVSLSLNCAANSDNDGALGLAINGSQSNSGVAVMQAQNGGVYNGRSTSGAVYLAAGDYIEMHTYHTVALITRANPWAGFFSGYLIG